MIFASTLEHWLKDATFGLGRIAKKRIGPEITAHYNEAYRLALESGQPEEEANALALESLGDAKIARKRFSKTHLNKAEEEYLSGYVNMNKFRILYLLIIPLASVVTVGGFTSFNYLDPFDLFNHPYAMLSMLVYGAVLFWSQRRLFRGHIRNIIGGELMFFAMPLSIYFGSTFPNDMGFLLFKLSLVLFLSVAFYFIRWKLMFGILRKMPKQLSEEELNLLPHVNVFGKEIF